MPHLVPILRMRRMPCVLRMAPVVGMSHMLCVACLACLACLICMFWLFWLFWLFAAVLAVLAVLAFIIYKNMIPWAHYFEHRSTLL